MEELVAKAKEKDENAFSELIKAIEKELYLIARTKLNNNEDIGDAIQETILKGYKNIKKLKNNSAFKTWMIKILINECNILYRKKEHTISYEEKEMEMYVSIEENNKDLEFEFLIKDLNNEEKLILTMYYCSKYTTKEISKILKIKESTIKSKIFRAKEKLRKKIMKEGETI